MQMTQTSGHWNPRAQSQEYLILQQLFLQLLLFSSLWRWYRCGSGGLDGAVSKYLCVLLDCYLSMILQIGKLRQGVLSDSPRTQIVSDGTGLLSQQFKS